MSVTADEQQRLYNFQKNTQNIKKSAVLDIEKERKYLKIDFRYFKKKLKEAYKTDDTKEVEKNIQALLKLLAKKLALNIKEKQEIYDEVPDIIIEDEVANYTQECLQLLAIQKKILEIYGR
ncbi:MAG: hypothetical protein WC070_03940 [Candidatus Magasanikbacteria bacterium]